MRILQNNSIRQGAHHSLQVLIPPPVRCVDPPWFSRFRIASSCASPGSPAAEPLRGTPGLRRRGRRPRRPDPSFLDRFRHGACVRRAATPPPEGEARAGTSPPLLRKKRKRIATPNPSVAGACADDTSPFRGGKGGGAKPPSPRGGWPSEARSGGFGLGRRKHIPQSPSLRSGDSPL